MTLLRAHDGEPNGLLKIVRDQSSVRTAEEALVRALELARRSNEARGRLMAVAGHDLRQPMQVISMVLDLLRLRVKVTDARAARLLAQGQEACSHLLTDLDALAQASALIAEAGLDLTAFPIAQVLSRIGPR